MRRQTIQSTTRASNPLDTNRITPGIKNEWKGEYRRRIKGILIIFPVGSRIMSMEPTNAPSERNASKTTAAIRTSFIAIPHKDLTGNAAAVYLTAWEIVVTESCSIAKCSIGCPAAAHFRPLPRVPESLEITGGTHAKGISRFHLPRKRCRPGGGRDSRRGIQCHRCFSGGGRVEPIDRRHHWQARFQQRDSARRQRSSQGGQLPQRCNFVRH